VQVQVNGQAVELPAGATIAQLLDQLGIAAGPVAVERNREIVPRAQHTLTRLQAGDQLEVVQFVGGG
jgi:sulfur carrier protein